MAVLLAVPLAPAGAGFAAHPFYLGALQNGVAAWQRGEHATAAQTLELAAFGLLDEPPLLLEALVPLALAQQSLGQEPQVRETVDRILEVETRFSAYHGSGLADTTRAGFEALLLRHVLAIDLLEVPAFAPPAERSLLDQVAGLAPAERQRRLEELVLRRDAPSFRAELATLALELKNNDRAIAEASAVLALMPQDDRMRCVRGLAFAGASRCVEAVEDLGLCSRTMIAAVEAEAQLDCLLRVGRVEDAVRLLALLPPTLQEQRNIRRLARELSRVGAATEPLQDATPSTTASGQEVASGSDGGSEPPVGAEDSLPDPAPIEITDAAESETAAERAARLAEARAATLLVDARSTRDPATMTLVFEEAMDLSRGAPQASEVHYAAAEIAYRGSRWPQVVEALDRAGGIASARSDLWFYLAVARYEIGDLEGARSALEAALPGLDRTPFVQGYVDRIVVSP